MALKDEYKKGDRVAIFSRQDASYLGMATIGEVPEDEDDGVEIIPDNPLPKLKEGERLYISVQRPM